MKNVQPCSNLLDFLILFKVIFPILSKQTNVCSQLNSVYTKHQCFDIDYAFKAFIKSLRKIYIDSVVL